MNTIVASWVLLPCAFDCCWLRDVGGDSARQMELEARRRVRLGERRREPVDDVQRRAGTEPGDVRLGQQLRGVAVLGRADVLHAGDVLNLLGGVGEAHKGLGVGRGDRAVVSDGDDDDRDEGRLADERLGEVAGDRARCARGQEGRVVVVDLARQRGKVVHRCERPDEPDDDDQPAELHGEASKAVKEGVHRSRVSVSGLGGIGLCTVTGPSTEARLVEPGAGWLTCRCGATATQPSLSQLRFAHPRRHRVGARGTPGASFSCLALP